MKDRPPKTKKRMTSTELLNSGLIGLWKDRTDIGDTEEFARKLRERAQKRSWQADEDDKDQRF